MRVATAGGHIRVCHIFMGMGKQRAGEDVGEYDGAHRSQVVHWVEVDVPSSCSAARLTGRAVGLRTTVLPSAYSQKAEQKLYVAPDAS